MNMTPIRNIVLAALLGALPAGCAYDYTQHTDRVGYSAGDAVRANIERETSNPARDSAFNTTGLGKNGVVNGVVVPQGSN
jgi:hypothetical protein